MKQQNCNDMKIQNIYNKLMYKINTDKKYEGYKSTDCANALNPNTEKDVARQIYRYFPTHFYKVRKTFEVIETESKNTAASLMLQNKISLIDVGSGACTMLLGLLDYLDEHRNDTYNPNKQMQIDVLLIEECKFYNDIIDTIIDAAQKEYDVVIKYNLLNDNYPSEKTINAINDFILKTQSDYIIYSFCNVAQSFMNNKLDEDVVNDISNTININRNKYFLNIFIIPYKDNNISKKLNTYVNEIYKNIDSILDDNSTKKIVCPHPIEYCIHNLKGSYYEGYDDYPNKYTLSYITCNNILHHISDLENLKNAYFKVRAHIKKLSLWNETELRLYEYNLYDNLKRLQAMIVNGNVGCQEYYLYDLPKNTRECRPYTIETIEDQIISCAIINVVGQVLQIIADKEERVSFGNRLNIKDNNEYLYEYYGAGWRDGFIKGIMKEAEYYKYFLKVDLKSYFTTINQQHLIDTLYKCSTGAFRNDTLYKILMYLLKREYDDENYGLGQGPLCSGFFANVYLIELDDYVRKHKYYRDGKIRYFRYVDDIVILYNDASLLNAQNLEESTLWRFLSEGLRAVDEKLKINASKSTYGYSSELKEIYKENMELNSISKKLNRVMSTIYLLKGEYVEAYNQDEYGFMKKYVELLKSIGINVNIEFLRRKIICENKREQSIYKKIKSRIKRLQWIAKRRIYFFVRFPQLPNDINNNTLTEWKNQFANNNPGFMNELVAVKNLLKEKLLSTLMDFKNIINGNGNNNSQIIKEKISAIRFFSYRLKYFCGDDVENVLRELLDIPLFIDSSLLQEYSGFCIDLLSIINNHDSNIPEEQEKYVKLILMQAAGAKDSPMPRKYLLDGVESDNKTERLIASSALVKSSYFNQEVNDFDRELILRDIMERNSSIVANGIYLMRRNGKGIEGIDKMIDYSSNIINNAVTTDVNIDIFSRLEDITGIDPYNYT